MLTPIPAFANSPLKLLAASSPFTEQALQEGLNCLRQLLPQLPTANFFNDTAYASDVLSPFAHLAGPDELRAGFLNQALGQPGLSMMVRGGFGISRLLDKLDWHKIKQARPWVIGFSDFSALLNVLANFGLASIHGPSIIQLPCLDEASLQELALFIQGKTNLQQPLPGRQLVDGNAKGKLMGGNLSMLCHLLGTSFSPDFNNAIVAIEEVNEPPYSLDRLLTKLELADVPSKVSGIVVGDLHGWQEQLDEGQIAVRQEIVATRLAAWNKPVLLDLPFGHARRNRLLLFGAQAEIRNSALYMGL